MTFCGKCGRELRDGEICGCSMSGSGTSYPGGQGNEPVPMHAPSSGSGYPAGNGAGTEFGGTGNYSQSSGYSVPENGAYGGFGSFGNRPEGGSDTSDGMSGSAYLNQGNMPGAAYPNQGNMPGAAYPNQGNTPGAAYPNQGNMPGTSYPNQGNMSDSGYGNWGNPYGNEYEDPNMEIPGSSMMNKAAEMAEELTPAVSGFVKTMSSLWISFKNRVGLGEPETNDVDYYERNLEIVPQCIDPDSGEVPVKQYNLAILRTRLILSRAEGRLQVTNKRVIFRATGRSLMGRTTLQHEFAIDEIAGIKLQKDYRFSFFNLLGVYYIILLGYIIGSKVISALLSWGVPGFLTASITISFTLLSVIPFFTLYKKFPLKIFFIAIGLGMLGFETMSSRYRGGSSLWTPFLVVMIVFLLFMSWIICWVPNLLVNIETKGTQPAVEIRRKEASIFNFFRKPDYTGFAEVMPWKDTEIAIIELWAMVSDIQKYGDDAIEQWKAQDRG